MSLIGPRPDPLDDMDIYTEYQKKKLAVRPGITGYNQAWPIMRMKYVIMHLYTCH